MTFLKLSFSSLCILTSSAYKDLGVEPVARPNTTFSFLLCFSLISSAICLATKTEPSFREGKIFTGIFSKLSERLMGELLFAIYSLIFGGKPFKDIKSTDDRLHKAFLFKTIFNDEQLF